MIDTKIKKIAVLTSGGDAPGMNAAIRGVVRAAAYYGKESVGIYRGYEGLIDNDFKPMDARTVANIIHLGGTMLKTARSKRFMEKEGRAIAIENLKNQSVDALVVIGGDGSFRGASALMQECDLPIVGLPGTIDNDMAGTDFTIGYDTACNTVIKAVDAIRDTAWSHNRLFFIEVMGRDSGFIALRAGLAAGVETIVIPEQEISFQTLVEKLRKGERSKKSSALVVVAEGNKSGNAHQLAEMVIKLCPDYDTKVTVLGHVQRGGSPSCTDREIASRMGVAAVEALLNGQQEVMIGIINNEIAITPFPEVVAKKQPIQNDLLRVNDILSV